MKQFLFIILFSTLNTINAQEFEEIDGKISYTKIVETSKKKDEIYKALKLWLNNTPNKSKNFIDVDDPNIGIISFNMISEEYPISSISKTQVEYKVIIEYKDNKFRFKASDFLQKYNLFGTKITLPYKNLSDLSSNKKRIVDLENEKKSTTKEKKIKEIDSKIADEKIDMELKLHAFENFNKSIENFPNLLKEKIEKYTNF